MSGKAILNPHSANPYCTPLPGLKLLDRSFLLLSNIMQSFCNCSNEGSSLPTSIFRKHESHITLRCQLLHGFPQDPREAEREGREEQNILAAAFWSEIFVFIYKQGTITCFLLLFLIFLKDTNSCTQSDSNFYFPSWILFSMMPHTAHIFRDHEGGSLLPTQKLMHLFLGLAHRILTQLQKLKTAFYLGDSDTAEICQNSGK